MFPCYHTVIETRVEVWENEKLKWEHRTQARKASFPVIAKTGSQLAASACI